MMFTGCAKNAACFPLTLGGCRDRMIPNADVVELVDSLDLGSNARACRFESCHPHQTNIIRTRFSPWEMGSDYLFISRDTNKSISPMAHPFGQIPNREGHAKRRLHKQRGQPQRLPSFSLYSVRPAVLASVQILLALPGQHMRPVYHQTRSERTAQRHTAEHRSY